MGQSLGWRLVNNIMKLVFYLGLIAVVTYAANAQILQDVTTPDELEEMDKRGVWDNRIRLVKKRSPWDNRIRLAKKWDNRIRLAKRYMDWDKRIRFAKKSNWDNRIRLVKKDSLDHNEPLLMDYHQEEDNMPSPQQNLHQ